MRTDPYPRLPPRRRWPLALAMLVAGLVAGAGVGAGVMLLAGYERGPDEGSVAAPTSTAPAVTPSASATQEVDPYEEWLQRAPEDAPELSRDDALARALLGCEQEWPPGTTDAILQEVYADHITC